MYFVLTYIIKFNVKPSSTVHNTKHEQANKNVLYSYVLLYIQLQTRTTLLLGGKERKSEKI